MYTPSVQLYPGRQPCARAQAASKRTVVVLPLDPVTSAVGISDNSSQGTSPGEGNSVSAKVRLPRPAPKVNSVSSAKCGNDLILAASISAPSLGAASTAESCRNLASAARSSMTGRSPGTSSAAGLASSVAAATSAS